MKKIIFAGLLVAVMGCASFNSTEYSDTKYPSTSVEEIKIFNFLPPEIQAQYEPIGEVSAKGAPASNRSKMELRLKEKAAVMGGHVIVLKTENNIRGLNTNNYGQSTVMYSPSMDGIVYRRK